ncbi:carbon storage regulator [Pseudoxanthomonas sp. X-1]|uniref:carbon storage regulator n=1 Tax=Pseudoxanthomonas sp. X-1 TaxID=2571115 RepID=UPI0014862DBB|nr:carbon storage regulator [Pseudoxanthomonas sp. X-1]UAY75205.1 carbon storage regulator [Pseudoxanthomonas sp. X-1]
MKNDAPPGFRPAELFVRAGTTIFLGDDIQIQIRAAHRGRAKLHVYAPKETTIDRAVNFVPEHMPQSENSDGPSVGAPEPSAK